LQDFNPKKFILEYRTSNDINTFEIENTNDAYLMTLRIFAEK